MEISEILPLHAKHADKFSLVRSCYHTAAAVHDTGHQMMQTGRLFTGGINTPHAGCASSYLRGRRTDLPAHVLLPEPMGPTGGNLPHGQEAGFLGKAHDPFALMADPSKPNFKVPDLLPPPEIGEARLERRRSCDDRRRNAAQFRGQRQRAAARQQLRRRFSHDDEPSSPRGLRPDQRADRSPRAVRHEPLRPVLLAGRRLIEAGVRFVTVNTFLTVFNEITWDIHGSNPFTSIDGMRDIVAPMYDQAYSALLEDLQQRGMLDNTLVCNLAEFGRTPRVNPAGGRDHWPQCWTVYFAGGGIQGGRVVGRSDRIGGVPAERPVDPPEILATIYHSLGLNLETTLPGPQGRPFPLVDTGKHPIHEFF